MEAENLKMEIKEAEMEEDGGMAEVEKKNAEDESPHVGDDNGYREHVEGRRRSRSSSGLPKFSSYASQARS